MNGNSITGKVLKKEKSPKGRLSMTILGEENGIINEYSVKYDEFNREEVRNLSVGQFVRFSYYEDKKAGKYIAKDIMLEKDEQNYAIEMKRKCELFDEYFDRGDYDGALRSELIQSVLPARIPSEYMTKAIISARKILGIEGEVELSEFDKAIIVAKDSMALRALKTEEFIKIAQKECVKECNEKAFLKLFNNMVRLNINVTRYVDIARCFQEVHNMLFLPFYVLVLYTTMSISQMMDRMNFYYEYVKKEHYFEYFNDINLIIQNTVCKGEVLPQKLVVKVMAIALDNDRFDLYEEFVRLVLQKKDDVFIEWMKDDKRLHYAEMIEMLDGRTSERVVEKYINYYMYKKLNNGELSEEMIDLLSEIAYIYPISYLEEIVFNNSYTNFSSSYKKGFLINYFDKIVERIKVNRKAYVLACFVAEYYLDKEKDDFIEKIQKPLRSEMVESVESNREYVYEIYPLFKLDSFGKTKIENIFKNNNKLICPDENISIEEARERVKKYDLNQCYFLILIFLTKFEKIKNDVEIEKFYLTALIQCRKFGDALQYIKRNYPDGVEKTRDIIKILALNFKTLGLSRKEGAYRIFKKFPINEAEKIVLDNFLSTNGAPLILMAIYREKQDFIRVMYIYSIYYELTKVGNKTFYHDLQSDMEKLHGIKNHYQVIRLAFTRYSYEEMFSFLKWASKIRIDKRYKEKNVFDQYSKELSKLIKDAEDKNGWDLLKENLAKNGKITSSVFGYAVHCMYMIRFYTLEDELNQDKLAESIQQLELFTSFSETTDFTNFIALNILLLEKLPERYAIKFCEFLKKDIIILSQNKEISANDIEKLYLLLLDMYVRREINLFFDTALLVYDNFSDRISPHFERYKKFCLSHCAKEKLFCLLFKKYTQPVSQGIYDIVWSKEWNCTEEEKKILRLLRIVYALDGDEIPSDIAKLSPNERYSFKKDLARMLQNYPDINNTDYNALMDREEESIGHKLLVLKYVVEVAFAEWIYRDVEKKYQSIYKEIFAWEDMQENKVTEIANCLDFWRVCNIKLSSDRQEYGIEFVSRRYINILLCDIYENYLIHSKLDVNPRFDIKALIEKNNHSSLKLDYDKFVNTLEKINDKLEGKETEKILFIKMLFRGSVIEFCQNSEITNAMLDDEDIKELMLEMVKKVDYPSLSQSALWAYDNIPEKRETIKIFCKRLLLPVYKVVHSMKTIEGASGNKLILELVKDAWEETDRIKFLKKVLNSQNPILRFGNYEKYKDIIINAVIGTVYNYNVVRTIGNQFRAKEYNIRHEIYRDLLSAMHKESLFYYLSAVREAQAGNKKEAKANFVQIKDKDVVPELWQKEYEELQEYLEKEGNDEKFQTKLYYNNFDVLQEEKADATKLLRIAKELSEEKVSEKDAGAAFKIFVSKDIEEDKKLEKGSVVLTYVGGDETTFRQIVPKTSKEGFSVPTMTYNEFLFEYGLLLINNQEKVIEDKKLEVIIELFGAIERLKTRNRDNYVDELKKSFGDIVTQKVVLYSSWLKNYEKIRKIIVDYGIELDGKNEFNEYIEICRSYEYEDCTNMEKIEFFSDLLKRSENNFNSGIAKRFLDSIEIEKNKLQENVMASIFVINKELENNSLFVMLENKEDSVIAIRKENAIFRTFYSKKEFRDQKCLETIEILRPGQKSGERIVLPKSFVESCQDGDQLKIFIELIIDGVRICKADAHFTYNKNAHEEEIKAPDLKYYDTKNSAFQNNCQGFGRAKEIAWLDENVTKEGITVLYGPSRVGKTSLMQYVATKLAKKYGEQKKVDIFVIGHRRDYWRLPSTDIEKMEFLFLQPIADVLENNRVNVMSETQKEILNFINDSKRDLLQKLESISHLLEKDRAEIWVLIDEFQQVVENIGECNMFKSFCEYLAEIPDSTQENTKRVVNNIRYVLCGSDALVKMLHSGKIKYLDKKRGIGSFDDVEEYKLMLCDSKVWGEHGSPYTDEALNYIYEYTNGNALYGKLIGNKIIDAIKNNELIGRKKVYPYDVSFVMKEMMDKKLRDINVAKEFQDFINNVTKNLEKENPYLVYIASVLMENPNCTSVSLNEICGHFGVKPKSTKEKEIIFALEICTLRGILKEVDSKKGNQKYAFSTLFYYSQYCELVNSLVGTAESERWKEDVVETIRAQENPSGAIIDIIEQCGLEDKVIKKYESKTIYANNYIEKNDGELTYHDNRTQNITINAQTIAMSFNTLLTSTNNEDLVKAFEGLPTLEKYLLNEQKEELEELKEKLLKCNNPTEAEEIETRIEALTESARKKMTSDTVSASAAIFATEDFSDITKSWQDLLKLEDLEQVEKIRKLPIEYVTILDFAVMLHSVFTKISDKGSKADKMIDYCPVAIMYCKLVEKILRKKHTPLYRDRLGKKTITKSSQYRFEQFEKTNGFDSSHEDLTIGAYTRHLVFLAKDKFDLADYPKNEEKVKDNEIFTLLSKNIDMLILGEEEKRITWEKHSRALKVIQLIRNRSAHAAEPITKEMFDGLVKILFKDGELLRMWELAED